MVEQTHALIRIQTAESFLSLNDLAIAAALQPRRVEQFVSCGLLEPSAETRFGPLFSPSSIDRLRRILCLKRDLGINLAGMAVVSDLREKIESLQREMTRLRSDLQAVD
jgi:MerR family transcriptional regulator, heat shock protein HspR